MKRIDIGKRMGELKALLNRLDKSKRVELFEFLDTVDSKEELFALSSVLNEAGYRELVLYYCDEVLGKWPNPKLSRAFKKKFPLLSLKLNAAHKIRVFLRCADYRGVNSDLMGEVVEDMLHRHEILGEKVVIYKNGFCKVRGSVIRFIYLPVFQAWTLFRLVFPAAISRGSLPDNDGVFISWLPKEER